MYIWGQKTTIITFLSSRLGGGCVENNAELMVWLLLLLPPTNAAASVNRSSPTLQLNKMLKTMNEEASIWEEVISLSDSLCEGVIQFVVSFTTTSSSLSCFYLTQKLWGFRLQLSGWLNVAGKGKIAIRCLRLLLSTRIRLSPITTKTNKQMRPPYG